MTRKVTGTWLGEYTYGPGYQGIAGTSVPFTMSLTDSLLRRVAGYVRDDAAKGGQPERGRITGTRRGSTLTFVKTMPAGYVIDADGTMVEKSAWLQRVFGIDAGPPAEHRIEYEGELSADGQTIRGRWQIRATTTIKTAEGVQMWGGGSGTWSARRISDLPSTV